MTKEPVTYILAQTHLHKQHFYNNGDKIFQPSTRVPSKVAYKYIPIYNLKISAATVSL